MIIMAVDPGTAKTGYAILNSNNGKKSNKQGKILPHLIDCSCVNTPKSMEMHYRLEFLYKSLFEIANEFKPNIMIIEKLFFNTNAKTAISVGQARGVPMLIAAYHKIDVIEYTALQAKLLLAGYGRAEKKEMQKAVKEYMQLDEIIKPDDANDALAMGLCFLNKDYEKYNY